MAIEAIRSKDTSFFILSLVFNSPIRILVISGIRQFVEDFVVSLDPSLAAIGVHTVVLDELVDELLRRVAGTPTGSVHHGIGTIGNVHLVITPVPQPRHVGTGVVVIVGGRCIEHEIHLKHFLRVAVTLDMEVVKQLLGGDEGVIARVDYLSKSILGTCIITLPKESLTLDGVGNTLGNPDSTVLVIWTLALGQVRHSVVAILDDKIEYRSL